jgi:homoserine kinase
VLARAPASSANLGPGFDAVALALALYVEVEVTDAPALRVTLEGAGSTLPADATNLAVEVACKVAGHDRLAISVRSDIPVGRGLGSSAAVALAAAAAAGAEDPLAVAIGVEGHPENAAASMRGGLVAAAVCGGVVRAAPLALDPALRVVVVVPDIELATADARAVLADPISRADAVFNLQHLAILLSGLADLGGFDAHAMDDQLHQERRTTLFPQATAIADLLRGAGALGACWSGAGPSMLAVVTPTTSASVADAGRRALRATGLDGTVLELAPDHRGLVWG